MNERFAQLDAKIDRGLANLRSEILVKLAELESKFERRMNVQTRWAVVTWLTVLFGVASLWLRR